MRFFSGKLFYKSNRKLFFLDSYANPRRSVFSQPLSCLYQAMQTPTFSLKVHVISLNFIAFIISIETESSLLARAKSIDYCYILRRLDIDSKVGTIPSKWQISKLCNSFKTFKVGKQVFDIFTI